jgi:hypothetical protein
MSNFSQEEVLILDGLKISAEEVTKLRELHGEQDFVTAVGGVLKLRQGGGMERNEPFVEQPAVEGAKEVGDVKSISIEEFNALSPEDRAKFQA